MEIDTTINQTLSLPTAWKATKRNYLSIIELCKWLLPPQNAIKLNVDGEVLHDQKFASVGIIIRNIKGQFIMVAIKKESEVVDPLEIELLAILQGLQLSIPLGIRVLTI